MVIAVEFALHLTDYRPVLNNYRHYCRVSTKRYLTTERAQHPSRNL